MNKVFELVSNSNEQVVLKVLADDPLVVAMYPYVSGDMAYITVTKGENHILTVINKNANGWSFNWGTSGYTLISSNTERLKKEVLKYIDSLNISIEYQGQPVRQVNVYYNDWYKKWEISITPKSGHHIAHFSEKATCLSDIMAEAEDIIPRKIKRWAPWVSPATGHKSYIAIFE